MTKRFSRFVQSWNRQDGAYIFDRQIPTKYNSIWVCMDIMNELAEENKQLKKQLDETIEGLHKEITTSENAFEGLMNENKELRDACKGYDWYKLYKQLLNENEQLKKDNEWLFKCIENQSALIHELDSVIMAYNMEHKITIKLTEKDLKTLDKALSYYTHQKVEK